MADVPTTFTGDNNEDTMVLALARQLEYYFSKQNLAHDTYLKTLMSLNDGCVPLTILASFRKVRAICGHDSRYILDVLQTNRYLQLFKIDTTTSKRVADELLSANTILAVGPRYEPLLNSSSSAATFAVSMMNNTIVLEINTVPTTVTRNEVEALLDSNCPPVTSITRNAANWWYVMFELEMKSQLLNGWHEYAHHIMSATTPTFSPFPRNSAGLTLKYLTLSLLMAL
jgi:hypothetical protein